MIDMVATKALERRAPQEMTFDDMLQMGDHLVRTGFLPQHIRNGAQAAAIILAGRELGMPPMRALRSMQLIKGKVVESADSQLARFKADGGRAAFDRLDADAAVLKLRHPNGDEHTESFTMDDARAAGLSDGNYKKFPKAMLRSRVITAALKSIGWDGAVGNYDPDEAAAFAPTGALATDDDDGGEVIEGQFREEATEPFNAEEATLWLVGVPHKDADDDIRGAYFREAEGCDRLDDKGLAMVGALLRAQSNMAAGRKDNAGLGIYRARLLEEAYALIEAHEDREEERTRGEHGGDDA